MSTPESASVLVAALDWYRSSLELVVLRTVPVVYVVFVVDLVNVADGTGPSIT